MKIDIKLFENLVIKLSQSIAYEMSNHETSSTQDFFDLIAKKLKDRLELENAYFTCYDDKLPTLNIKFEGKEYCVSWEKFNKERGL